MVLEAGGFEVEMEDLQKAYSIEEQALLHLESLAWLVGLRWNGGSLRLLTYPE